MTTDITKANIIQYLFKKKKNYHYVITRKNGKVKFSNSLFCWRHQHPETIAKVEKVLITDAEGYIDKEVAKKLNVVSINNTAMFLGFGKMKKQGKQIDCLKFKEDDSGGWYSIRHIDIEEILALMGNNYDTDRQRFI